MRAGRDRSQRVCPNVREATNFMQIYNTQTRKKEEFVPLVPGKVGIYVCGPTVYDFIHIGNARPTIVFDTLRRYLEYRGYDVKYVQNLTDIDDKMIARANQEGITVKELGERFIAEYFKDADSLNVRRADVHPRATDHIGLIIGMIKKLEKNGKAYAVNGSVYFSVASDADYGKLSGRDIEELMSGARVEVDDEKRDPMDFALWKAAKPGEPSWDSPWGKGRPGWHIECSAMSTKYLGETFDIHCGGQDLVFPHHENEVAQSECATGKPFVRYWMHNGYINIDNQKMSKSLGNFFTVRDIGKEFDLEALRMFMLSAHYRSPINFSRELIEQAKTALERLYNAKRNLEYLLGHAKDEAVEKDETFIKGLDGWRDKFCAAMDDDLNTADALGVLFEAVREINSVCDADSGKAAVQAALALLNELSGVLGLLYKETQVEDPEILALVEQRTQARKDKNWAESDRIRDLLKEKGIVVEDTPQGAKIHRV